jgi:hypothetical protein
LEISSNKLGKGIILDASPWFPLPIEQFTNKKGSSQNQSTIFLQIIVGLDYIINLNFLPKVFELANYA